MTLPNFFYLLNVCMNCPMQFSPICSWTMPSAAQIWIAYALMLCFLPKTLGEKQLHNPQALWLRCTSSLGQFLPLGYCAFFSFFFSRRRSLEWSKVLRVYAGLKDETIKVVQITPFLMFFIRFSLSLIKLWIIFGHLAYA